MLFAVTVRCPMCKGRFTAVLADGRIPTAGERYQVTCPLNGSKFRIEAYRLQQKRLRKDEADAYGATVAWLVDDAT